MTREKLAKIHEQSCNDARSLMKLKGHDYATDDDPLRNFRRHGLLGIAARIGDKLARLEGFIRNDGELQVTDETIDDTCADLINYSVIFKAYVAELREEHNGSERKV